MRQLRRYLPSWGDTTPDTATRTTASMGWCPVSEFDRDPLLDHPLVVALLERLAGLVARRVRPDGESAYYTTLDNPLNSARAFKDAARRGDFPLFKLGRLLPQGRPTSMWIGSRPKKPALRKTKPASREDAVLTEFGLRPTAPKNGTRGQA